MRRAGGAQAGKRGVWPSTTPTLTRKGGVSPQYREVDHRRVVGHPHAPRLRHRPGAMVLDHPCSSGAKEGRRQGGVRCPCAFGRERRPHVRHACSAGRKRRPPTACTERRPPTPRTRPRHHKHLAQELHQPPLGALQPLALHAARGGRGVGTGQQCTQTGGRGTDTAAGGAARATVAWQGCVSTALLAGGAAEQPGHASAHPSLSVPPALPPPFQLLSTLSTSPTRAYPAMKIRAPSNSMMSLHATGGGGGGGRDG